MGLCVIGLWALRYGAMGFWAVGFRLWGGAELPVSVSVSISVQAEEFHALVHSFLGRLSEAEKTLKYGLGPPEERSAQQCQLQLQVSAGGGCCSCTAVPASIAGQCQWGQLQLQGSANRANICCRAVPMGPAAAAGQC